MSKEKIYNKHHLIGQSLEREYRVDMPENILTMQMIKHNALHSLFGMLLAPQEQLGELRLLYNNILSDHAKELFDELLSLDKKDFYIDGIVRKRK